MSKYIYLAGPIYGQTYDGATGWRDYATKKFNPGIIGISPMRGKEYLAGRKIDNHTFDENVLSTFMGITARDRYDCTHADGVLAVFPADAPAVSVGSIMELGWASANNIPIVVVSEDPRIKDHGMVRGVAGWIVPTLDAGIHVVNAIFTGYVKEPEPDYEEVLKKTLAVAHKMRKENVAAG